MMTISEFSNNKENIIKWEKQGTQMHATVYLKIYLGIHTYMHIYHSGKIKRIINSFYSWSDIDSFPFLLNC